MNYKKEFGRRLTGLLEDAKIPEGERVSELRSLTKTSQPSAWAWLRGRSIPEERNLLKLVRRWETTADYLLFGLGNKHTEGYVGLSAENQIEDQLLKFFRGLDADGQSYIIGLANREYSRLHPEDREANPYPGAPAVERRVLQFPVQEERRKNPFTYASKPKALKKAKKKQK